jgi:hypothetical protein
VLLKENELLKLKNNFTDKFLEYKLGKNFFGFYNSDKLGIGGMGIKGKILLGAKIFPLFKLFWGTKNPNGPHSHCVTNKGCIYVIQKYFLQAYNFKHLCR